MEEQEKIRIVFITHYTNLYGANRSMVGLIYRLRTHYPVHPLVVVPERGDITELLNEKKISFIIQKTGVWMHTKPIEKLKIPFKIIKHSLQLFSLYKKLQKFKPQLIQSNSSVIHLGFFLSRLFKVPHIWHIREFGKEDYNYHLDFGESAFTALLNRTELIVAISKAIAHQRLKHVTAKKVIVYNGIIPESRIKKFHPEGRNERKPFIFIMVGKIMPSKGQLEAVRALSAALKVNKDLKLNLIGDFGDETYKKILMDEIGKLNLQNHIIFSGYVKNPESVYEQSHALLMCSRKEGMGRVTVEALSYGLPVLGYDGGATPEIVIDQVNGFLFHDFDVLAKLMLKLSSHPDIYHTLSAHTSDHLHEFTNEYCADQFYKAICPLLEK